MTERRKGGETQSGPKARPTSLPVDYLRMVAEVLTTNFEPGLKALEKLGPKARFDVHGEIYSDEIVLRASLLFEGQIAATTAYASSDFDPQASSPKLEELLGSCVDALGAVFAHLLDPENIKRLEQLSSDSLAALEDIPFEWTRTEINRRDIHVRVDKANPGLDKMADDWLAQNDPRAKDLENAETESAEEFMEERLQRQAEDKARSGGRGPTYH